MSNSTKQVESKQVEQSTMGGRKNLNVSEDTYDRLRRRGKFGESFDDLVNRILNELEELEKSKPESKKKAGGN
jgi:predicted CopG family antitoxin